VTRQPKLLYLVSEDWYFVSHRLPLAIAAKAAGFDVSVATLVTGRGEMIRDAGLRLIPINFARSGLHPLRELRSISELAALYLREAPDLVHNVAVKPVIYGTRAARRADVKGVVNALMGLGWAFSSHSPKAQALRPFIKRALRDALSAPHTRTIVQNADDAALLTDQGLTPPESVRLIRGSGVDPGKYMTGAPPSDTPLVVFPARLLVDKGVEEFLRAATILKKDGVRARFALVGEPDPANPASLDSEKIEALADAADAELWGWREDMPNVFAEATIVCLPSYREGLPKALLEAAASARAIVATDVPGCREIVRPGVNGWLVPPRNAPALAAALREAIARPDLCARYGAAGRRIVEREFSLDAVIRDTLAVYGELVTMPTMEAADAPTANAETSRRTA
jgi:glycosyltransferase involved in cell wall biosynthesis